MTKHVETLSDVASEENIQRMMKFLHWTRLPIPTLGISWPSEIVSKYGETAGFTYIGTSHMIAGIKRLPDGNQSMVFFEPNSFFMGRMFFELLSSCNKKLERYARQINNIHGLSLLRRLYCLDFLNQQTYWN